MRIHVVRGGKKVTAVRNFLAGELLDPAVLLTITPEDGLSLGFETTVLACYDSNGIVGALNYSQPFEEMHRAQERGASRLVADMGSALRMLNSVAVREDCRGQNVGRELVRAAEYRARQVGAIAMIGVAKGDMTRLPQFYESLDYEVLAIGEGMMMRFPGGVIDLPLSGESVRWFRKSLHEAE